MYNDEYDDEQEETNGSFIKKSDFGSYFCQGVIYNTPIEAVYAYMVNLLQSNQ